MGIKNLKTLLLKSKSLLQTHNDDNKYCGVFVDTMSFFVSIAHCVDSLEELAELFLDYVTEWFKLADTITLFIDKGDIQIKEPIRIKRRKALQCTMIKKTTEIKKLYDYIENLPEKCFMRDEIITEKQLQARRLEFHVYLANSENLYQSLERCISLLDKKNIRLVYCYGKDAEFNMCLEAYKLASLTNEWPLIISTDQDTLLFASLDYLPKTIKTVTQTFRYLPTAESKYISKLTTLVNGCDFFPGLRGICLTDAVLEKMLIFNEFTIENVICSLVRKNYYRKRGKR